MDTLSPPTPSRSPTRMPRRWARKCERYCCLVATYFPLLFVYSITSWAVWVEATIGFLPAKGAYSGPSTSLLGITLYVLLIWSYTTAVFTNPGNTTNGNENDGYKSLPTHTEPIATNFTVKANGELRYCKKCQARKPDRAHHCSTCKRCVLKMDHHCPWLATCVGLRNYKAFLLFLIYTSLFCFVCFFVSAAWVWREIVTDGEYTESLMPINYVMLAVISGIIGIVLAGFTIWHIMLAARGQTTIECLEKTRYLSPLRKSMQHQHIAEGQMDGTPSYGQQLKDIHANEPPAVTSPDGDMYHEQRHAYDAYERQCARERYEEYLDEQDSEKLPSAFDLGRGRNLGHLFGPKKTLWAFPICNTTGNGWSWEPSPKWLKAREKIASEREAQRLREHAAGWGAPPDPITPLQRPQEGAGRHYVDSYPSRSTSKADRILGRSPNEYADGFEQGRTDTVSMHTLRPRRNDDGYDISSDEDEAEQRVLNRKAADGWPQTVGVVTNALLGNTIARQKDNVRGWDGQDDGVD